MEIEISNLSFSYSTKPVLENINLTIKESGLTCIIGPNGVGKSTLVKCINRLLVPTKGTIKINGMDISTLSREKIAEMVCYVQASTSDCFSMPVIDTILVGRQSKQKWKTTKADLDITYKAMDMLGLRDLSMQGFNQLSAGQHQKVALARGLVQETDIMVLDEPTANLDVKHQVYVTQLLKHIADCENKMVIMICHDLNIASRYADNIIVMSPPGIIKSIGPPDKVITEDTIGKVYGIDCKVIRFEDRPHVILKSTFGEAEKSNVEAV